MSDDAMRWRQWAETAAKHLPAESGWDFVPAAMLEVLDALAAARSEVERLRRERDAALDECVKRRDRIANLCSYEEAYREAVAERDAARSEVEELKGALRAQNDLALERLTRAVAAEATAERLRQVVRWALGEEGEFPERPPGARAYWWRHELRARALAASTGKEPSHA